MKALSIRQPWAWLIAKRFKDVENRTWSTRFRGRIYVHAGKALDDYWDILTMADRLGWTVKEVNTWFITTAFGRGAIVGEVDIVDCVEQSDSPWFEEPHGFVLANPLYYQTPIPYKGKQGFFEVTLPAAPEAARDGVRGSALDTVSLKP